MNSIVGLYSINKDEANREKVEYMLGLNPNENYDSFKVFDNNNVTMGHVLRFTTNFQNEQSINYRIGINEYSIVFNGRIDNRYELLKKINLSLSENISDAQLVVILYNASPKIFLNLIEGDFSLGIWDKQRDLVLIAKDPLGMRTLFYSYYNGTFVWASTLKQILSFYDNCPLNEKYLFNLLLERPTYCNLTPYLNIYRVEPGEVIYFGNGRIKKEKYYEFTPSTISYNDESLYFEQFNEIFRQSVKNRLNSNQSEVGISLSGGLDSTSIAATALDLYSKNETQANIKSFSLTFNTFPEADESNYITLFTKEKKISTKFIKGDAAWLFKESIRVIEDLDEPYPLFTHYLSSLVPTHVYDEGINVLLDGHIGDHVLYGDLNYLALLAKKMKILTLINEHKKWKTDGYSIKELLYKNTILPLFSRESSQKIYPWIILKYPNHRIRKRENIWDRNGTKAYFESIVKRSDVEWVNQYIPNKMGIEVRHPFFDKRLMEFLAGVSVTIKIQPDQTKYILRKSMSSILPDEIINRSNKASHAPIIYMGIKKEWENINKYLNFPILSSFGWLEPKNIKVIFEKWYLGYSPSFEYFTGMLRALALEIWLQKKLL